MDFYRNLEGTMPVWLSFIMELWQPTPVHTCITLKGGEKTCLLPHSLPSYKSALPFRRTVVPKMVLWKINKQVPDCGAGGWAMEIEREAELINALWVLATLQGKLSETDKSRRGTTPQIMEPEKQIKVATNCLPNIPFLSHSLSLPLSLFALPWGMLYAYCLPVPHLPCQGW